MPTAASTPTTKSLWSLNRILLLVLACGYLTLMADVRVEHADRFRKFWQAWIPIYYSGTMAAACLLGTLAWTAARDNVRPTLFWLFALGFVVGGYGLYLHNRGDFADLFHTLVNAWITKIKHEDVPPQLAPTAFCGLALIGMLATWRRMQPAP